MILYNITVNMEAAIHEEWLDWARSTYLPEIMKTASFTACKVCRLLNSPNEGITYSLQFFGDSMQSYQDYKHEHSDRFQTMLNSKFENKLVSFDSLMEIIEEYTVSNFSLN